MINELWQRRQKSRFGPLPRRLIRRLHSVDYRRYDRHINLHAGPAAPKSTMAMRKSMDKPRAQARQQQKRKFAYPNSLKNLNGGQGKRKSGGNGQAHHYRFILALAVAQHETKRLNGDLPNGNVVDSESNVLLLESFMQECNCKFDAVHDMKSYCEWPNKVARCCEINKPTDKQWIIP